MQEKTVQSDYAFLNDIPASDTMMLTQAYQAIQIFLNCEKPWDVGEYTLENLKYFGLGTFSPEIRLKLNRWADALILLDSKIKGNQDVQTGSDLDQTYYEALITICREIKEKIPLE